MNTLLLAAGLLVLLGLLAALVKVFSLSPPARSGDLPAIDRKLDRLLNHFGIDCPSPFSLRVRQLAVDPRTKIAAIIALREETGMGLREARDAIESGMCGLTAEQKFDLLLKHLGIEGPLLEWQELARDPARKIAAIKAYREATGVGLKEAKDAVEQWMAENGY
jgi:ribosomal protein L7/L12